MNITNACITIAPSKMSGSEGSACGIRYVNEGDELNNISWCMALPFQPPASAISRYKTLGKVRSRGEGYFLQCTHRVVRQSIATVSAKLVNLIPLLKCPRWKSLLEFIGTSFEYRYENSIAQIENASKVAIEEII